MIKIDYQNKIDEIKHIRDYAMSRYGCYAGLKESKGLIDSVMTNQQEKLHAAREALDRMELDSAVKVASEFLRAKGFIITEPF